MMDKALRAQEAELEKARLAKAKENALNLQAYHALKKRYEEEAAAAKQAEKETKSREKEVARAAKRAADEKEKEAKKKRLRWM